LWASQIANRLLPLPKPWLFNVYIDDLAQSLARLDPQPFLPPCLLFADDILLLPSFNVIAKRMLSVVATWSVRNAISVKLPKCVTLCFLPPLRLSHFRYGNKFLPVVKGYTYLGMPFTASGIDFKAHLHSLKLSIQKLLCIIKK
jgi:hypothetical protein